MPLPDEVVAPVGLKGRLLGRLHHAGHPLTVALVGALFAVSFDTISQSALFALTAIQFGGVGHALLLGLLFTLGMLVTDGINGLWISRSDCARRPTRVHCFARDESRGFRRQSAGGGFGAAKLAMPAIDAWSEGKELVFGATVMSLIGASFVMSRALAQRATPSS